MTPREEFQNKLIAAVEEFEAATGVEIHGVSLEREDAGEFGGISKTVPVGFQFNFR